MDLTKAFDTDSREGLWRIMSKFGCPDRFILMVSQFHNSMMACVLEDGEASEAFPVTNGIKQGCVLAPPLFSIKVKETVLRDLLFADDCALNAVSEQEMQASVDKFAAACDNFGVLINTKVMHQPAPKAQHQEPTITVKGQKLQAVD
ncbi:unnamed protein product [Staurois parvus]|uniref:Reverse transcriptase domain-containing protein n=1 Tax=Staurois parvus TaxID=386267 RepID=A0ABN9FFK9_9NEOB|nr:unnamed protein product [Staurois parvus]